MSLHWFDELDWVVCSDANSSSPYHLALGPLAVIFIDESDFNNHTDYNEAIKTACGFEEGSEILGQIGYGDETQSIILSHFKNIYPSAYHIAFEEKQGTDLILSVDVNHTDLTIGFTTNTLSFQSSKGYSLNQIAKVVSQSIPELFLSDVSQHTIKFRLEKENQTIKVLISLY